MLLQGLQSYSPSHMGALTNTSGTQGLKARKIIVLINHGFLIDKKRKRQIKNRAQTKGMAISFSLFLFIILWKGFNKDFSVSLCVV